MDCLKPMEMKSAGGADIDQVGGQLRSRVRNESRSRHLYDYRQAWPAEHHGHPLGSTSGPLLASLWSRSRGNFVLAELELVHKDGVAQITGAFATYEQGGEWNLVAENAVDRNRDTGWAVDSSLGKAHAACFQLKNPMNIKESDTIDITLHFGAAPVHHSLGRFRLSVTDDPNTFVNERKRLAATKITDPWARVAAAYHVLGDQPALESLLRAHPLAGADIGDLYAAEKNWNRAIALYTKAITPETKDARLLVKRAQAYEKLKQWDLATADWSRASQQQSDVAFERSSRPAWVLAICCSSWRSRFDGSCRWDVGNHNDGRERNHLGRSGRPGPVATWRMEPSTSSDSR